MQKRVIKSALLRGSVATRQKTDKTQYCDSALQRDTKAGKKTSLQPSVARQHKSIQNALL
jgi:hypothetical protein